MGNIRTKNPISRILEKSIEVEEGVIDYRSCAGGDVTVHCLDREYYVEGKDCTLGPMTRKQLEALRSGGALKGRLSSTARGDEVMESARKRSYKMDMVNEVNVDGENIKSLEDNILTKSNNQYIKTKNEKNIVAIKNKDENNKLKNIFNNEENIIKSSNKSYISRPNRFINRQFRNTFNSLKHFHGISKNEKKVPKVQSYMHSIKQNIKVGQKFCSRSLNRKKSLMIQEIFKNKIKFIDEKEIMKSKRKNNVKIKMFNLSYLKRNYHNNQKNRKILYNFNDINKNNVKSLTHMEESHYTFNNDINSSSIRNLGFTEPINSEKIRYTAYSNVDSLNWSKQKALIRRMSFGFQQRFGCNVQLGNEPIQYRGSIFYTVNIDGKDQISVLKCRNCLPEQLKSTLIQPANNGEESFNVIGKKWNTPYNPNLIEDYGTNALKVSY